MKNNKLIIIEGAFGLFLGLIITFFYYLLFSRGGHPPGVASLEALLFLVIFGAILLPFLLIPFMLLSYLFNKFKLDYAHFGVWMAIPIAFLGGPTFIQIKKEWDHARPEKPGYWSKVEQQRRKAEDKKRAIYYRLQATYRHKHRKTGKVEVVKFDLYADCRIAYFMKATADGGAIMLHLPDKVCTKKTSKRNFIPKDYTPVAVWFDDVHNTDFGWAYANDDAYKNPWSQLKFDGASITKKTYSQWQSWRHEQKKNFKPIGSIKSPYGWALYGNFPERHSVPDSCKGYAVMALRKAAIKKATMIWPSHKPRFWSKNDLVNGYDKVSFITEKKVMKKGVFQYKTRYFWYKALKRVRNGFVLKNGMPTEAGGGVIGHKNVHFTM